MHYAHVCMRACTWRMVVGPGPAAADQTWRPDLQTAPPPPPPFSNDPLMAYKPGFNCRLELLRHVMGMWSECWGIQGVQVSRLCRRAMRTAPEQRRPMVEDLCDRAGRRHIRGLMRVKSGAVSAVQRQQSARHHACSPLQPYALRNDRTQRTLGGQHNTAWPKRICIL